MKGQRSGLSTSRSQHHHVSPDRLKGFLFLCLFVCLSLAFPPALVEASSSSPAEEDLVADYFYTVDASGVTESITKHIWLAAGESFVLASKATAELTFKPTDKKAEAYAYEKPDCKLDKAIKYTTLFPKADAGALWTEPPVSPGQARGEYKKLYKFQNPAAERLPPSLTEFCLLVSTPSRSSAGRNVPSDDQEGQAEVPTVTLVFHSSAFSRGAAMSLLAPFSAVVSSFLFLS